MTTPATQTLQVPPNPLVERLRDHAFNRERTHLEHLDSVYAHHEVRAELVEKSAAEIGELGAQAVLEELRGRGLLWSVVAEVVGVTDSAVRKWRRGQAIEPTHRRRLDRLAALGRLYDTYAAPDGGSFGQWLDSVISPAFSASPLQLIRLTRDYPSIYLQPLLDWAFGATGSDGAKLLDNYLGAAWREAAQIEQSFRIITNAAGERLLVIDE
jgi:DNA-binding transcriptional regulator YiaG